MADHYLRKHNSTERIDFELFNAGDTDLATGAAFAVGDVKIMKDEGTETNVINLPVDEGLGYSWLPSSGELQCARAVVYIIDQSPKVWRDKVLIIETYGHANAQHARDLDADDLNKDGNYTYDQSTDSQEALRDGVATLPEIADEVHDEVIEGTLTFRNLLRIFLSALGGITTNNGTNFRDYANGKNRIQVTVDANGNRTSIALDGS